MLLQKGVMQKNMKVGKWIFKRIIFVFCLEFWRVVINSEKSTCLCLLYIQGLHWLTYRLLVTARLIIALNTGVHKILLWFTGCILVKTFILRAYLFYCHWLTLKPSIHFQQHFHKKSIVQFWAQFLVNPQFIARISCL